MSIHVPFTFPRLNEIEMAALDYEVMAHVFATHRELGRLCDENVYAAELAARLEAAGLGPVRREMPVTISFRDFSKTYETDLVVQDRAIYEMKVNASLTPAHEAQLLNYLLLCNATRGKLVNFRAASVQSRFVNTSLDHAERRRFEVNRSRWNGEEEFAELVVELLSDWGTALEAALYMQAITYLLGGEGKVIRQIPMQCEGRSLGRQRFHLFSADTAFAVTTFTRDAAAHEAQLSRLLKPSPLRRMFWVNVGYHDVTLTVVERAGRAQTFNSEL